jgi:hypothetical protein
VKLPGRIEKRLVDQEDIRDKNPSKKRKHSSGSSSSRDTITETQEILGKACKFCGHQLGKKHLGGTDGSAITCTLLAHPQSRSSNNIRGGVHYSKLMDGTTRINPGSTFKPLEKKSNTFHVIYDDIYLTDNKIKLLSNLNSLNNANPYLSITLFQNMEKGDKESANLRVQALPDTGSLAGDFISDKVLSNLSLPLLICNTDFSVCSGMDGNCINKLNAIDLYVSMCTENALSNNRLVHTNDFKNCTNNKFDFETSFYI